MKAEIHLRDQSKPVVREDVVNTYVKGPFYCVYRLPNGGGDQGVVEKYPVEHIFRVVEDY